MHVTSPVPHKKARIEIIPLIDIMFFLLASFMMVSLSQVHMKGMKVNLPSGSSGETQQNANTSASRSIRMAIISSTKLK
jgi:Biopolymer transport protein